MTTTRRTQRPTPSQLAILERCAGGTYVRLSPSGGGAHYWPHGFVDRRVVEACERKGFMERRTTISGRPVSVITPLGRQMLAEEGQPS